VLGSSEVTQFAVPARLFAFIGVIAAIIVAPLWPAYGEALARGDTGWVKLTLVRTLVLTAVLVLAPSITLVVFGRPIIHAWVGNAVQPSFWLLAGLGTWALLSSLGATLAVFLNGASVLRFQAVCAILVAMAALGLEVAFARLWGVSGVPWALVLAYAVFAAIPMVVYVPRLLERLSGVGNVALTTDSTGTGAVCLISAIRRTAEYPAPLILEPPSVGAMMVVEKEVAFMTDVPDKVQRWTPKRKAAAVIPIVRVRSQQQRLRGRTASQSPRSSAGRSDSWAPARTRYVPGLAMRKRPNDEGCHARVGLCGSATIRIEGGMARLIGDLQRLRAVAGRISHWPPPSEQPLLTLGKLLSESVRSKGRIASLREVEFKIFSQWGDDGIIQWLLGNLDFPARTFIEFGVQNYRESNTRS